jgi:hypothetical protein
MEEISTKKAVFAQLSWLYVLVLHKNTKKEGADPSAPFEKI